VKPAWTEVYGVMAQVMQGAANSQKSQSRNIMNLNNFKIGTRLAAAFSIVLALLVGAIGLGLNSMGDINAALVNVVSGNNVATDAVNDMRDAQRRVAIHVRNIVLLQDDAGMAEQKKGVEKAREDYGVASKILNDLIKLDEGKAILAKIAAARTETLPVMDEAAALGMANKKAEGTQVLMNKVIPAAHRWVTALSEMIDYQTKNNEKAKETASKDYAAARQLMLILGALALVAGMACAWIITRSIVRPVSRAVALAQSLGAGRYDDVIGPTSADETGMLLRALGETQTALQSAAAAAAFNLRLKMRWTNAPPT